MLKAYPNVFSRQLRHCLNDRPSLTCFLIHGLEGDTFLPNLWQAVGNVPEGLHTR